MRNFPGKCMTLGFHGSDNPEYLTLTFWNPCKDKMAQEDASVKVASCELTWEAKENTF